ncbi:hypothetical protein ABZ916_24960 [Streptomyces sp. NPDC046853]
MTGVNGEFKNLIFTADGCLLAQPVSDVHALALARPTAARKQKQAPPA